MIQTISKITLEGLDNETLMLYNLINYKQGDELRMECECGKLISYNHHYQCYECDHCERVYNAMGQELAPIDEWANDWDNEGYYD